MGSFNLSFPVSLKKPLFLIPSKAGRDETITQVAEEKPVTGQEMPSSEVQGLKCKYCGEMIPGNRGNLLAHVRQCDKRPLQKEGD